MSWMVVIVLGVWLGINLAVFALFIFVGLRRSRRPAATTRRERERDLRVRRARG